MSRSFKHKPFQSITGTYSAKQDKRLANRGVRKAHREALHKALLYQDYDVLLPHRLECSWNEVYSWGRDGHQMYQGLDARDWFRYLKAINPEIHPRHPWAIRRYNKNPETWPPSWYLDMMRK